MLYVSEFSFGSYADAEPGSIILPRTQYEQPTIVGSLDGASFAVPLEGATKYQHFPLAEAREWYGLILASIRILIDEKTIFDPNDVKRPGALIRKGTRLSISAKERWSGRAAMIVLLEGLSDTGNHQVGFSDWQITVGHGVEQRILWTASEPAAL